MKKKEVFWQKPNLPIVVSLMVLFSIFAAGVIYYLKVIPPISSRLLPSPTPREGFMKPSLDTIQEWEDLYESAPPAHFDYCVFFGGQCISIHEKCEGIVGGLEEVSCGSSSMRCCLPEKCQPDKIIGYKCDNGNDVPWCECINRGDDWYCVDSPQEKLCGKPTCEEKCRQKGYTTGVCRQPKSFPDFCLGGEDYIGNASDCYSFTSGINGEKLGGASKACCCQ